MPSDIRSFADARAPRLFDPAMIAAVRREEVIESAPVEPAAVEETTGPQYWARARVTRPPVTRSRTGIQLSPYMFASDEQVGPPEMLKSLRLAAPGLIRTAHEILDVEGPMPMPRLITLLARRFGIPRLDPQRRYHVTRVVAPQFVVVDDFAWPTGTKPSTWRGARRIGDPRDRRIVDISPEELENAMEFVLGGVEALSRDALLTETATLLGYPRIPVPAKPWVEAALDRAVASGRFLEADGFLGLR
jgi:hypothetical protein